MVMSTDSGLNLMIGEGGASKPESDVTTPDSNIMAQQKNIQKKQISLDIPEENASLVGRLHQLSYSVGPQSIQKKKSTRTGVWGDSVMNTSDIRGELMNISNNINSREILNSSNCTNDSMQNDKRHFITSFKCKQNNLKVFPQSTKAANVPPKNIFSMGNNNFRSIVRPSDNHSVIEKRTGNKPF